MTPQSDAQLYPLTANPVVVHQPAQPSMSEMVVLGSMLRSLQQNQNQQTLWLRDFDARINRIEISTRPPAAAVTTPAFERATWWAIWGLLMLVLGGALTIVIMLILLNLQFK